MNYNAEMPIYLQVIHDLKKKMIQGKILPGEKLPSNRELAVLYKINQNTAARIYREMEVSSYSQAGERTARNRRTTKS